MGYKDPATRFAYVYKYVATHGDYYMDGTQRLSVVAEDNTRVIPTFSEQASELGEYLEKFEHSPKIQSCLSYRVLRKP